jgi:hypothetical protein
MGWRNKWVGASEGEATEGRLIDAVALVLASCWPRIAGLEV